LQLILSPSKNDLLIASLTALAIAIHVVESSIPSIIPGIKPGLSNVIVLICLFSFGFKIAVQVSLLRVFIVSLLIGTFLSPTFILSLAGALSSLFSIAILWLIFFKSQKKTSELSKLASATTDFDKTELNRKKLSYTSFNNTSFIGPIGISIVSSISHILGQFYMAWYLYIPHPQLFKMLPIFIAISVILGLVSGLLALVFLKSEFFNQIRQYIHTLK
jgi:heptaprenyl diphosphate synthase